MFASQNSSGSGYTRVAALLAFAFFLPAICIFLRPGYVGLSLAFAGSASCLILAWVNAKRSRRLAAIATEEAKSK